MKKIAIFGASGAIGTAVASALQRRYPGAILTLFSRTVPPLEGPKIKTVCLDILDEQALACAAEDITQNGGTPFDLIFVANGGLHEGAIMPERSLRDLSREKFTHLFEINTIGPALIAKHFLPHLSSDNRAIFAALTSRVGSLEDNKTGGWYAYRASKVALVMVLKNISIEIAPKNKNAIIIGVHPGTVDSALSKPFQRNLPANQLVSPEQAAENIIAVIEQAKISDSGKNFAWDGQAIAY